MRKNPYQILMEDIKSFCEKVRFRKETVMWEYPKGRLDEGWTLGALYERTVAAEQLGFEVVILAKDGALSVRYRKKVPDVPYKFRS